MGRDSSRLIPQHNEGHTPIHPQVDVRQVFTICHQICRFITASFWNLWGLSQHGKVIVNYYFRFFLDPWCLWKTQFCYKHKWSHYLLMNEWGYNLLTHKDIVPRYAIQTSPKRHYSDVENTVTMIYFLYLVIDARQPRALRNLPD